MLISISFQFHGDPAPAAITGVEGDVSDILLPAVGDLVKHVSKAGVPFTGRVTDRVFQYDLPNSQSAGDGSILITLHLDRNVIH